MDPKLQTKVTDENRQGLYSNVYARPDRTKDQLIQLDGFGTNNFVLVDSGAQNYRQFWSDVNIIELEALNTLKSFKPTFTQGSNIIDDSDYHNIKWPILDVDECVLIFDYPTVLKYRTIDELIDIISTAASKYNATNIVFRSLTTFIDDTRLTDRFINLSKMLVDGYVVTEFVYTTNNIKISYKKKS